MNDRIIICKHCGKPEYWGEFRWLNGKCCCRDCYKADREQSEGEAYRWNDLDGKRPTMDEYNAQEAKG